MNERERMEHAVRVAEFAMLDAGLFLDSHPNNREALVYFNRYREQYNRAKRAYEEQFGPTNMTAASSEERWTWVDDPWPWQKEA